MSKKAALVLAVAALASPPLAGASTPTLARGAGILDAGCPLNPLSANVVCPQYPIWFSLQAKRGPYAASGLFRTQWRVPGRATTIYRGSVRCLNVDGNAVVVGGVLAGPAALAGIPFVEYAVDNGATGDLVSDLGIFPFEDPDLVLLPLDFPSTCPTPGLLASIYGYQALHTGALVVRPGTP
jgi:hypothetical protein